MVYIAVVQLYQAVTWTMDIYGGIVKYLAVVQLYQYSHMDIYGGIV